MEWVASTLHTTTEHGVSLLQLMHTPRLPVVDSTDAPADLNGIVRFAETGNLVSARVPSHFKRSLPYTFTELRAKKKKLYFSESRACSTLSCGFSVHHILTV